MPIALVVADEPWVVNEVRTALTIGSWTIEEIADPRAVTARVEESRVDAVIVDMQVGSKGGMAVVRAIRQSIDQADWPRMILMLDRSADVFLARRAGADAWVIKPFEAVELRAAVAPAAAVAGDA